MSEPDPKILLDLIDKRLNGTREQARQVIRISKLMRHERSARQIGNAAEAEAFREKWEKLAKKIEAKQ